MADEPTSDLDPHPAEEVLDILSGLNRNFKKTIILVTHDPGAPCHADSPPEEEPTPAINSVVTSLRDVPRQSNEG